MMTKKPKRCSENEAYANPEDRVDRAGRMYVALNIREKYGITFDRWLQLIDLGVWFEYVG